MASRAHHAPALLDAVQEVFELRSQTAEARRLARLVLTQDYAVLDPDHVRSTIWPTNVDREAFSRCDTR